jgi:hypothetical protein
MDEDAILRGLTEALCQGTLTRPQRDRLAAMCQTMVGLQARALPPHIRAQRKRVRAHLRGPCRVQWGQDGVAQGTLVDVGLGGIGVLVDRPTPPGEVALATLELADLSRPLVVQVKVYWMMPDGNRWRLGLRFHHVPWRLRALLTRAVLESASHALCSTATADRSHGNA